MGLRMKILGIVMAFLILLQFTSLSFANDVGMKKPIIIDGKVYDICIYRGFPAIIIYPLNNTNYKMFVLIKGLFSAFEAKGMDLPIKNRIISVKNLLNAIRQVPSGIKVKSLEDKIKRTSYGRKYSLVFNKFTWTIRGPFIIFNVNGEKIGEKYVFSIVDKDKLIYADNISVVIYIFEKDTFVRYNDKSILVRRGEVKVSLIINNWRWETIQSFISDIHKLVKIEINPSLILLIEATAPVIEVGEDVDVKIYAETRDIVDKLTVGSEVRITGSISTLYSGFIGIKNLDSNLNLISIVKFIGLVKHFKVGSYRDIPVTLGVYRNTSSIDIYVLMPYLEGGTIVYDPIFTLANEPFLITSYEPKVMGAPMEEFKEFNISRGVSETAEGSFTSLMEPSMYIPNIRLDILLGVVLSALLLILASLVHKMKVDIES